MQPTGRGRIVCWEGGSLWLGAAVGDARSHDHHAIQISLTFGGTIRFRTRDGDWRHHSAALIPPHLVHAFDATDASTAQIFVEPETSQGRGLLARYGRDSLIELPATIVEPLARPLRAPGLRSAAPDVLIAAAHRFIDGLAGATAHEVVDARVARVIAHVRDAEDPVTLEQAAAVAALSPGRLRHLFVEQTGQSFRSYQLWVRLQRALQRLSDGSTATDAAHAAGFADAAHLTRTFRRMMGIAPTSMRIE